MIARLTHISHHLPARVETAGDLQREFPDWNMDRVAAKTGIHQRHLSAPGETAADLAYAAARKLFESGISQPGDIDFLLFCTQTPDYFLPTSACLLQHRLGLPHSCGALDVNLGCSGYVYALSLAKGLVETGQAESVLILTADTYTKMIRPDDRNVRSLFGDGAAASLVTARPDLGGEVAYALGPFVFGTDGGGGDHLVARGGGFRAADAPPSHPCLFMNGPEVFAFTLRAVPESFRALLEKSTLAAETIDLVVPHQANAHMLSHLRDRLEIAPDRFVIDLADVGNTVSASIPIALARRGVFDIKGLSRIALLGFGVGLSWGGCLLTCEPVNVIKEQTPTSNGIPPTSTV